MNLEQEKEKAFVGVNGEQTGLGFSNRDQGICYEEEQGSLKYKVITNDRTHYSMKFLVDLKNIFSRQLPKMPKEYIVKLMFDRNHRSMIILKNENKVIGGICFRQYDEQKFAEIAFLAVTANEQVKGYGTRLMNRFKEYVQSQSVEYLLTYADNFAIGYFKKQGFTKEGKMNPERWKGYIKDYDGGTLMECYIHPRVNYSAISQMIKAQKENVIELVKKLSINETVFPGLKKEDCMKQRKTEDNELIIDPETVPGIMASGWTMEDFNELKKQKERSFNLQCQQILDLMKKHKSCWPFLDAVNKEEVPDYYDIIKDPIDIKSIDKKLQQGYYQNKESFIKDVSRIFANARQYNQPDTVYFRCANELEHYMQAYLDALKEDKEERSKIGVMKRIKKKY